MSPEAAFSPELPLLYILAGILLALLSLEAFIRRRQVWRIPALVVYATTALWYFVEIIYTPENYLSFSSSVVEMSYFQVIIFLTFFRIFTPFFTKKLIAKPSELYKIVSRLSLNPARLLAYISILWFLLLLYGASRLNWDFFQALFPLAARAGRQMWGRGGGASAGAMGFIISSAGYTYSLLCAFFGVMLLLQTRFQARVMNLAIILISWPYFILLGTRNQFLAVAMPAFFTYVLISKQKWWIKIGVSFLLLIALNYIFTIVIAYRNIGFDDFLLDLDQGGSTRTETKHLGLNMAEELFYVNTFYTQGAVTLKYGFDYLADFLNFIPRVIWPSKPILGYEYNVLRGFGSASSEIGVFATIAAGFLGRGVLNFGPWLGPIAPAFLLGLWAAFLARLWSQSYSVLRLCLFLVGLGITPNLGRDITLLVLWPMIFGYTLVRFLEWMEQKKLQQVNSVYSSNPYSLEQENP